ncbi:MAG: phytoene desaturase family protein [Thermomicrobiales bacterium]
MAQKHVVIIGAGMGGLAAAIRLAAAGARVTVCEQGARPGGKLNRWERDGWTFDTGPSLLTMPWVLRDLFAEAGASLDDYLTLDPVDPVCRYFFADGAMLDVTTDSARMAANIDALSPRDVPAFFRFLGYAADLYALAGEPFLRYPLDRTLLRRERATLFRYGFRPRDLTKLLSPLTVHQTVSRFFSDPRLRQVFDRYATYNGSSPYRAPAAFCLIPFVEFATGAWHPRGGMYRIAEALTALATHLGVDVRCDTPVAAINQRAGGTAGVRLTSGEVIPAHAVISNVDVLTTVERLFETETAAIQHARVRLRALEPSYSGFVLLLGTNRPFPALPHHSIYFPADYEAEFRDILDRHVPPHDPTIYICRATATDPSAAPPGCDNLFIMVNVPHLDGQTDWRAIAAPYRDHLLEVLRRRGLDLAPSIIVEDMWTPERIASAYGAQRGAIYGFASNNRRAAFLRPPNKSDAMRNLYFAGGSTHPGGGIPLALLSGKIAADLILDERREYAA